MNEFIEAFRNTSYYKKILSSYEVIMVYISGSHAIGIIDEKSDYDIAVLTLGGSYVDVSEYEYLMYKGKKVHWYIIPIDDLFNFEHYFRGRYTGLIPNCVLSEELIIYKNFKYETQIQNLYSTKNDMLILGLYYFFENQKKYIEDILNCNEILEKHHLKILYHLCLASYVLLGEEFNKSFLSSIKRIRYNSVPNEYKELAVERLKLYRDFINTHPIAR